MSVSPAGNVSVTLTFVATEGPRLATVSVYVTLLPATTGSGSSVIRMETPASVVSGTRVVDTDWLLLGLWPGVVDETVTRSDRRLPGTIAEEICSVRPRSMDWPASSTGITQTDMFVTPAVGGMQVIPGGTVRPMTVDPGGMIALVVTLNAGPGPKLVARAVVVMTPPDGTLAGASNVIPTSAWSGTTKVETLAALLSAVGSGTPDVTVAVLT